VEQELIAVSHAAEVPCGRLPLLSASPAVTVPATDHRRLLASTKLHSLVTEAEERKVTTCAEQ